MDIQCLYKQDKKIISIQDNHDSTATGLTMMITSGFEFLSLEGF